MAAILFLQLDKLRNPRVVDRDYGSLRWGRSSRGVRTNWREMGSGKKRERESTASGESSGSKDGNEPQSSKKAKIEDSTSASEGQYGQ